MIAMIDAFQACIIKVGCGIGGWDMLTWTSFPNSTKMNLLEAFSKRQSLWSLSNGKANKKTLSKTKNFISTSRSLELLHMNLFGPSRTPSLGGKSYAYVIMDDFSRYIWVLFLSQKNEAFYDFSKFCNKIRNEKDFTITCIRSDYGREFEILILKNIAMSMVLTIIFQLLELLNKMG